MKKIKFLFIPILLLTAHCVPTELDNIEAFEYTFPELAAPEPLPDVVLVTPDKVVVTTGEIKVPQKAEELVTNVVEAIVADNISEENLTLIDSISELAPEVTNEYLFAEVDEAWIEGVLNGTIAPSSEFLQISNEFEDNEEFSALLSQFELPKIDGIVPGGRLQPYSPKSREIGSNPVDVKGNLRIAALVVPCKLAADSLYTANVTQLNNNATQQETKVKSDYNLIRNQVNADNGALLISGAEAIAGSVVDLSTFAIQLNDAVDKLDPLVYDDNVKRGLKIYVAAFVLQGKSQINDWLVVFNLAATESLAKNLNAVSIAEETILGIVKSNLKLALDDQATKYIAAVNNCHNQGAGG
jgi:hypothetical protein